MLMQAIQLVELFQGIKKLVDSNDNNLNSDQVGEMFDGLGEEVKQGMNKLADEDSTHSHKNFMDFLKG